jgi:hypothetical protein
LAGVDESQGDARRVDEQRRTHIHDAAQGNALLLVAVFD